MTRSNGHARRYALAALAAAGRARRRAGVGVRRLQAQARRIPSQLSKAKVKQTTLCLLNRQRAHARPARAASRTGASPARPARTRATWSERDYFAHTAPGGVSFVDRIMRQDYVDPGQGWTLGENLAWGSYQLATPKSIVRSWMHSPAIGRTS